MERLRRDRRGLPLHGDARRSTCTPSRWSCSSPPRRLDYSLERVTGATMRERLHLLPPFRRRVIEVPFGLHHPVWIEDPDFRPRPARAARRRARAGRAERDGRGDLGDRERAARPPAAALGAVDARRTRRRAHRGGRRRSITPSPTASRSPDCSPNVMSPAATNDGRPPVPPDAVAPEPLPSRGAAAARRAARSRCRTSRAARAGRTDRARRCRLGARRAARPAAAAAVPLLDAPRTSLNGALHRATPFRRHGAAARRRKARPRARSA